MSEEMSNVDSAWLHMELPNNLMMITGLFIFDTPVDFERLKRTLEERFAPWERFRQRVVEPRFGLGSPRWELDPQYNISNHIHRVALPAPGGQAELQALVSDLMSAPLDFSKPLWQYHLVENVGEGAALVSRLHHSIGDGIALMRVLLSMTDMSPDAPWTPPVEEEEEEKKRSRNPIRLITRPASAAVGATRRVTGSIVGGSVGMVTHPSHAVDFARLSTETTMALGRLLLLPPDPKTIFKGPLSVPKRAAWSQAIPLSLVKAIGKATGTTVNDVLLSAVAGALRQYAVGREQPVDGLNVRGVIPVNLRQNVEKIELGNKFGLVFLSLPLGIEDPLERLIELKRRMDDLKDSQEAVVAFGILNAIGMAPTEIENIVVNIFGAKATAVMTNVPGPRQQIYFAGSPIKQLMFWVPQSGRLGMGVSIFSYNDQVWLGVATDVGLMPDPDTIIAHFHAELDGLYALAQQVRAEPRALPEPAAAPAPALAPEAPAPAVVPAAAPAPAPAAKAPAPAATAAGATPVPGANGAAASGAATGMPGDDLTRIAGIGPAFAAKLQAGGISTYAALAGCTPDQVAAVVQAPDWRRPNYQGWIDQARALAG